jgi:hypothetical protein
LLKVIFFIVANLIFVKKEIYMKLIYALLLIILSVNVQAQAVPVPEVDKSPMDMSYCPAYYPISEFQGKATTPPSARIIYGRPSKAGRQVFGGLIENNAVWRMGANESTEIEFFKPVTFGGKKIAKGRYTLFCIPTATSWTIIVNKKLNTWGAFSYDSKQDLTRFSVPVQKNATSIETLTIFFDATNSLNVLWDDIKVVIPVKF